LLVSTHSFGYGASQKTGNRIRTRKLAQRAPEAVISVCGVYIYTHVHTIESVIGYFSTMNVFVDYGPTTFSRFYLLNIIFYYITNKNTRQILSRMARRRVTHKRTQERPLQANTNRYVLQHGGGFQGAVYHYV